MAEIVKIMDFAADEVAPEFWVGEDHFVCVPDIPLGIMQKVSNLRDVQKAVMEHGDLDGLLEIFDDLLTPASAVLFHACVNEKKTIGVRRLMKILPWVMEEFGMRPTQPSLPSSTGQSDGVTGTSSEDGASHKALIQHESTLMTPSI
jgi:hypothetical protein